MSLVKVLSINILNDLRWWRQRSRLLVNGIAKLQPDLVALQEVSLPLNNSEWLADQLGFEYSYLSPKTPPNDQMEGIAILSRFPIQEQQTLDLGSQNRIAQLVRVDISGKPLAFVNGQFYFFWPGQPPERLEQIKLLQNWLKDISSKMAMIVCGDFNGVPNSPAVSQMKTKFQSAYEVRHGNEPEYTVPTRLLRMSKLETVKYYLRNLIANRSLKPWRGTLDYIFVNEKIFVKECKIALNQPAENTKNLFPSDHFGLMAELELL